MSALITWQSTDANNEPFGPLWFLRFDACELEEFRRDANVTQYPVESGAVLADHYQPQPLEILLEGVVTNTPVAARDFTNLLETGREAAAHQPMSVRPLRLTIPRDQARRGRVGIPRPISTTFLPSRRIVESNIERARLYVPRFANTLQTNTPTTAPDRLQVFFTTLNALMETRRRLGVILPETGAEFANMMITNHTAPRRSGAGGSIRFSVSLQQVQQAEEVTVSTFEPLRTEEPVKSNKRRGNKSPKKVTQKISEADQSVIDRMEKITNNRVGP